MSEEISKEHVGKYVCFQRADGGACWGRVKDQGFVNTLNGEREVVILTERYVRYERCQNLAMFRYYFPDVLNDPNLKKAMKVDGDGVKDFDEGELFFEVKKIPGDSTLRLESINVETDLMDLHELLEMANEKTLFEALLAGRTIAECLDKAKDKEIVPSKTKTVVVPLLGADGETTLGRSEAITDGGSGALGVTAIEIGLRHMIRTKKDFDQKAKTRLAERFGIEIE
jgi:hypothetical protein